MSSVRLTWADDSQSMKRGTVPQWVTFALLSIGGAGLDLASKAAVFSWRGTPGIKPTYWLIENYVGIQTAVNERRPVRHGRGLRQCIRTAISAGRPWNLIWLGWFGAMRAGGYQ